MLLPIVGQGAKPTLALGNNPVTHILGALDQPGQRRIIQPFARSGIKAQHAVLGVNKSCPARVRACGGHDMPCVCIGRTFSAPQLVLGLDALHISE